MRAAIVAARPDRRRGGPCQFPQASITDRGAWPRKTSGLPVDTGAMVATARAFPKAERQRLIGSDRPQRHRHAARAEDARSRARRDGHAGDGLAGHPRAGAREGRRPRRQAPVRVPAPAGRGASPGTPCGACWPNSGAASTPRRTSSCCTPSSVRAGDRASPRPGRAPAGRRHARRRRHRLVIARNTRDAAVLARELADLVG